LDSPRRDFELAANIAAGRVFVGSDNGSSTRDAATGCVYWSFEGGSIVRGSLTVGPVSGQVMHAARCFMVTATPTSSP
jgi:hypothetical protein